MHLPDVGALTPIGAIVTVAGGVIMGVATQTPLAALMSAAGLVVGAYVVQVVKGSTIQRFAAMRRERDQLRRERDEARARSDSLALRLGQYERTPDPDGDDRG